MKVNEINCIGSTSFIESAHPNDFGYLVPKIKIGRLREDGLFFCLLVTVVWLNDQSACLATSLPMPVITKVNQDRTAVALIAFD